MGCDYTMKENNHMNSEWSLDELYKGYDDPVFLSDFAKVDDFCSEINDYASRISQMEPKAAILGYIKLKEDAMQTISKLFQFASLKSSVNTRDVQSVSYCGRLSNKLSQTTKAETVINKYIASIDNLEQLIDSDDILREYSYMLLNIRDNQQHMLGDDCEEVMALYNISGGDAWSDLQSYLTSSVTANYRGKEIGLSSVRNLAYDPDPQVRRDAYEAELACYDKIKDSIAFSLNSIKLQVINGARLRGFDSPLSQTLYNSHMKRETLDALLSAMDEYMHVFRKYLRIKAVALGHKNGMPWYDMFAPMGSNDKKYTVEDAKEYLLKIFRGFDSELANMVERAFDEAWIDFYPHEGKVGGAFCAGLKSIGQSRVLTNFDGSFSDIVTLAHELGHAFHNLNIQSHRPLNDDYSMPVAETASTFNEHVVMDAAIAAAEKPEEKLQLIESQLMDTTQIMSDILSRYLFETAVFENREEDFMFPDRLCEMMLEAQKKAYGDGLDSSCLHPYMWVCKSHYYSTGVSFYNFPYAFGGLFARGLYAKYMQEGESFVAVYKKMLHATPVMSVEDAAAVAGIDLTKADFWRESLKSYERLVDQFEGLVEQLYGVKA